MIKSTIMAVEIVELLPERWPEYKRLRMKILVSKLPKLIFGQWPTEQNIRNIAWN